MGQTWHVEVYGITSKAESAADAERYAKLFKNVSASDLRRPVGRIDLLIGTDYCMLLPIGIQQIDNLQLMKNQFGYCVRGCNERKQYSGVFCTWSRTWYCKQYH